MTHHKSPITKSPKALRRYGFVMAGAFGVISAFLWWKSSAATLYVFGIACLFAILAVLAPKLLGPVEKIWMAFAEKLSIVMTTVILTITYYLVITPVGLLLRIMGKDLLEIKKSQTPSFWKSVEQDGPGTRPDKPY